MTDETRKANLVMISKVMVQTFMTGTEVVKTAFLYAEKPINNKRLVMVLDGIREGVYIPEEVVDYCLDVLSGRAEGLMHEQKKLTA